ncbi:MAG: LAGLIDADG family homing endonuclease, partial [Nanoarchaeota archaeon]
LLAGLIDTDGYVHESSIKISQTITRSKLIYQTQRIAQSLGFQTSVTEITGTYYVNGEKRQTPQLLLTISGTNTESIPTLLPHKKCQNSVRNVTSSNIKVKSLGIGKYNGFSIDGNNRFLLGDFTVTHNSSNKAKHSNGRPMKGIKERISSKTGLIRQNLMGKRRDQSGRSPISADPTVSTDELVVPRMMA